MQNLGISVKITHVQNMYYFTINKFCKLYAKQKQLVVVKKGAAKQSRINTIAELDDCKIFLNFKKGIGSKVKKIWK